MTGGRTTLSVPLRAFKYARTVVYFTWSQFRNFAVLLQLLDRVQRIACAFNSNLVLGGLQMPRDAIVDKQGCEQWQDNHMPDAMVAKRTAATVVPVCAGNLSPPPPHQKNKGE